MRLWLETSTFEVVNSRSNGMITLKSDTKNFKDADVNVAKQIIINFCIIIS